MHIEFLIEDQSGAAMLKHLLPKIIDKKDTYRIHSYKGVGGKIPQGLGANPSTVRERILLENLPRLLAGYGRTFQSRGTNYPSAVVVVCDLDNRNETAFIQELEKLLNQCAPQPTARFCLAIEEGEAWLLGDPSAVKMAYPHYKSTILEHYQNDQICGTWEILANTVYPGGVTALQKGGYHAIGIEKLRWAEKITPFMEISRNQSPSFHKFVEIITELTANTRHSV